MDDRARVQELLGRRPRGPFDVVVRDTDGDPIVIRNAPTLDDGTPMPTLYYLVGEQLVRDVSRLEAAGGVRQAEEAIAPGTIAEIHTRYAAERDALLAPDHEGPRPTGGVGGTRVGVKCLHAHVANHLAGGEDAVGAWALQRIEERSTGSTPVAEAPVAGALSGGTCTDGPRSDEAWVAVGDATTTLRVAGQTLTLPVGAVSLADGGLSEGDPPRAEDLSNAIGLVQDHLEDAIMREPALVQEPTIDGRGRHIEMLARVELGLAEIPDGYRLCRPDAEEVFRTLVAESNEERLANPGLAADHVLTILGTSCIVLGIMRRLRLDDMLVEASAPGAAGTAAADEDG